MRVPWLLITRNPNLPTFCPDYNRTYEIHTHILYTYTHTHMYVRMY